MRVFGKNETKRILIASRREDELPILESRLKARNYQVEVASTSIEVVHKVNRIHFDLILLDAKMEEVRHTELAELLRRRSFLRSIPIVMITDADDIPALLSSIEKGFDDFFVRPIDTLTLQLRVALNIQRAAERLETNPLTQLPGNVAIEKTLKMLIENNSVFSVIYADLDNFKPFNDSYGYEEGDNVLQQTAYILETLARRHEGRITSFVGHVGGDDFVLIVCPTVSEKLAHTIIKDFDKVIPTYYPESIRKEGYVEVKNRKGEIDRFPLVSISLAEVSNEFVPIQNPGEVAQRLVEVKKFLKTQQGSNYLKDRRGRPFTSLEEAERVLCPVERDDREPLGQILLKAGLITEAQLKTALEKHFETGERLGQILITLRFIESDKLGQMLGKKFAVPYMALREHQPSEEALRVLDSGFMRSHRVVPLEISGESLLYLGMVDPYSRKTIREIEEVTRLTVKPCLVLEGELETFFERSPVSSKL